MSETTGQIEAAIYAVVEALSTSRWPKVALADTLRRRCDSILGRV